MQGRAPAPARSHPQASPAGGTRTGCGPVLQLQPRAAKNSTTIAHPPLPLPRSRYKYIIALDGQAAPANDVARALFSGSLLLRQESVYQELFYTDLEPYVHYIPVSYSAGDLIHQVGGSSGAARSGRPWPREQLHGRRARRGDR